MAKDNFWIALVSDKISREGSSSSRKNENKQQSNKVTLETNARPCVRVVACVRDVWKQNSFRQLLILCDGRINMKKRNNQGEENLFIWLSPKVLGSAAI